MRIFLSASYHRRLELRRYAKELIPMWHEITSRWLKGPGLMMRLGSQTVPLRADVEKAIEEGRMEDMDRGAGIMRALAVIDIEDIMRSECFISFTEPPDSNASRGGRHVELGWVIGARTTRPNAPRIIVVGHRENIFHYLPCCEFAPTWEKAKGML